MNANGYSKMGAWSLGLSTSVGTVFLVLLPLARSFAVAEANEMTTGIDAPGAGLLFALGGLGLILLNLVALGLGVTGLLRERRRRALSMLGIVASILVIVLIYELGIAWEPPPPELPPGFPTEPAGEAEVRNAPVLGPAPWRRHARPSRPL